MDEETKAAFADVKTQLDNTVARLDTTTARLDTMMARMNDGFERILNEITTLKTDFQNAKGFLLEDAIVTGRRMLSIEDRLTRLERKQP